MTTSANDSWVLTPTEVAAQLGVSKETIRSWADKGLIECWRTPTGYRRFRQSDVDAFIALGRS